MQSHYTSKVIARFWSKVDKSAGPDGCWLWAGSIHDRYGRFKISGRLCLAHRVSVELNGGCIPDGMYVCHHCDNPACVNPDHLFIGSAKDNKHDCIAKGRMPTGDNHWTRRRPECLAHPKGELHGGAKLTAEDVIAIRSEYAAGRLMRELSAQFGICVPQVHEIVRRKAWSHIP